MTDVDIDLVERLVDAHHAEDTSPGLAVGVIHDGTLVYDGARGESSLGGPPPDAHTVFRVASMTKSFTAAAVLLLRDEGRLRLDDPVAHYVPSAAALTPPTPDAPPPTIRALLTMTAGLPTDDPWGDRQQDLPEADFDALLHGGLSFAWAPGTAFEYSNLGFALLGRVIAAAGGRPYPQVVAEQLLGPLGLTSTGYRGPTDEPSGGPAEPSGGPAGSGRSPARRGAPELVAPQRVDDQRVAQGYRRLDGPWEEVPFAAFGAFAAMGGLYSTVSDLARWVAWLCGAFPPRDAAESSPMKRASRREMQLPHLALAPSVTWTSLAEPPVIRSPAYGFGLIVEHDLRVGTLISHSGGYPGFGSHMRWHPGSGLGVVVLCNATYAPAARLGSRIIDHLLAADTTRPVTRRPGASPAPATGSLAVETAVARADVTRLITAWDDDLAARLLAMNVDLDDPVPRRRRVLAEAVDRLGPLVPDTYEPISSSSPGHCVWWLRGPGGRLRCEIRMTPERPSRVQTLTLSAVPTPSEALRQVALRLAAELGEPQPTWPDDVPLASGLRAEDLTGQVKVAAVWAGRCTLAAAVAGDGENHSTFTLVGERLTLLLELALAGEAVSACRLTPVVDAEARRAVTTPG